MDNGDAMESATQTMIRLIDLVENVHVRVRLKVKLTELVEGIVTGIEEQGGVQLPIAAVQVTDGVLVRKEVEGE